MNCQTRGFPPLRLSKGSKVLEILVKWSLAFWLFGSLLFTRDEVWETAKGGSYLDSHAQYILPALVWYVIERLLGEVFVIPDSNSTVRSLERHLTNVYAGWISPHLMIERIIVFLCQPF